MRPFLCRCDDDRLYYVKGSNASRRDLVCEWMAGGLGRRLGIPIPEIRLVETPERLIRYSALADANELGAGIGFGSLREENVEELKFADIFRVPIELQARVLLFDWWTANSDRVLGEDGGNPNLLWNQSSSRLFVIDHNLSFRLDMMEGFRVDHVFGSAAGLWTPSFMAQMEPVLDQALAEFDLHWAKMPEEWFDLDHPPEPASFRSVLERFKDSSQGFWRMP